MKTLALFLALSIISAAAVSTAQAENATVIRLITKNPTGTDPLTIALKKFAREVVQKSKGSLQVSVLNQVDRNANAFPALVSKGEFEMGFIRSENLAAWSRGLYLFDVPFLFTGYGHLEKILGGALGKDLVQELLAHNLRGMGYAYSGGLENISTDGIRLRRADDFKGLRLAAFGSPVEEIWAEHLGVKLVKTGVCCTGIRHYLGKDAVDGVLAQLTKYQDYADASSAQKIYNELNITVSVGVFVINDKFFQSLSAEHKRLLQDMLAQLTREERAADIARAEGVKRDLKKKGVEMVELTASERAALEKDLEPVYVRSKALIGERLYQAVSQLK